MVRQAEPPASSLGQVQLLSSNFKTPDSLLPGEHGIMMAPAQGEFDPETHTQLQAMADAAVLRQGYTQWYKSGGRRIESELVDQFNQLTQGGPLRQRTAGRFQSIVRAALNDAEAEDDTQLLDACTQALIQHGQLNADSFIELQRAIMEVNSSLHRQPSAAALQAAAQRQLRTTAMAEMLAAVL